MYIKKFLKHYYVMLVPAFLWLIFFSIVPMFGIIMAFEDYNPGLGMLKSPLSDWRIFSICCRSAM